MGGGVGEGVSLEERIFCMCRDQLGMMIRGSDLHWCQQRLRFLLCTLQLSVDQVEWIIRIAPRLLLAPVAAHLKPLAHFYAACGITPVELGEIAMRCPALLLTPVEQNIEMKIRYLQSIGVKLSVVVDLIRAQPGVFVQEFEFGFRKKIGRLLESGLSVDAVLSLMRYSDQVLIQPVEGNGMPKIEFFKRSGMKPAKLSEMLIRHPFVYFLDLEGVIIPFFRQKLYSK